MNSFKKRIPYLSVVIASRNDNHGNNMLQRMQTSLNGLFEQLEKYQIESELILVDWNPPQDKPLLKDVIRWPLQLNYCTVRVLKVPFSIYQRYNQYADRIPLNLAMAYNSGFRRAKGEFILPGVIDLLYSDELMSFIVSKKIKENERYRANRCDVKRNVIECKSFREQLEYCKNNIINVHRHDFHDREGLPDLHTAACGDFQLMSRKHWNLLRGYWEAGTGLTYIDSLLSFSSYAAGIKEISLSDSFRLYHIDHDNKIDMKLKVFRPGYEKVLSRAFMAIRPFIPSVIRKKIIFSYHKFIGQKSRSEIHGMPTLDYLSYLNLSRDIISGKHSYVLNDENWGLGQENLSEVIINNRT